MSQNQSRNLLFAGFTAVFTGYLTVWLPGPAAGLRLIGVEIGEWIKFLGVGRNRDLFYLPPITLGLMMALVTLAWPNRRWQTWVMRGLAFGTSLLALPAVEAVRFEPTSEWLLRLQLVGLVLIVGLLAGVAASKLPRSLRTQIEWPMMAILGATGAILPTWIYLTVRPAVSQAIGLPVGIGLGVWLNGLGHLLVLAVSLFYLKEEVRRARP
jgi:hypothetical protein